MSDTLRPHELQNARLPCPSLSPGVCSNSCPLSQCYHPTVSSSVTPFSSCSQSFSASGSFPMSQLFTLDDQSTGASASASVLPMNIQGWYSLGLIGLISLQSKRLWRVFSNTTIQKHQFYGSQPSLWSNSYICTWLLEKSIGLTIGTFVGKVVSLLFNMLSRFFIAFIPSSKYLLILWLQSLSTVILKPNKIKSFTVCNFSPSVCHYVMGPDAMVLIFWKLSFWASFYILLFHLHEETL